MKEVSRMHFAHALFVWKPEWSKLVYTGTFPWRVVGRMTEKPRNTAAGSFQWINLPSKGTQDSPEELTLSKDRAVLWLLWGERIWLVWSSTDSQSLAHASLELSSHGLWTSLSGLLKLLPKWSKMFALILIKSFLYPRLLTDLLHFCLFITTTFPP